jgi:hypothetical protein
VVKTRRPIRVGWWVLNITVGEIAPPIVQKIMKETKKKFVHLDRLMHHSHIDI